MGSGESERGTRNGGIDESWEGRLVLCCGSDAEARERERWMQLRFVCGGSDFAIITVGVETIEMTGCGCCARVWRQGMQVVRAKLLQWDGVSRNA